MKTKWVDLDRELENEDDSIYSEFFRESLIEDDQISAEEDGFMKGWDDALG